MVVAKKDLIMQVLQINGDELEQVYSAKYLIALVN